MKRILVVAALVLLPFSTTACAPVTSALTAIGPIALNASNILSLVENFMQGYFAEHPDKALQERIANADTVVRIALDGITRLSTGTQQLDQAKLDEALKNFGVAYTEFMNLTRVAGVKMEGSKVGAAPGGGLIVPEPIALSFKG